MLKGLQTQLATLNNQAKTLYAEIEGLGDKAPAEKRGELGKIIEAGKAVREQINQIEEMNRQTDYLGGANDSKTQRLTSDQLRRFKTVGELVTESAQFKESDGRSMRSVDIGGLGNIKATILSTAVSGGNFAQAQRLDLVDKPIRPLSIMDLVGTGRTGTNAVEYVQQATIVNGAAPVAEGGSKPETTFTWTLQTASVVTIAHWVAASRQVLADAPQLDTLINNQVIPLLMVIAEDQVVNGSGSGANMRGILNTSGIQTRTQSATVPVGRGQTTTDKVGDTIRRAITDIQLAFYTPDGVAMNPADLEAMELEKDTQGRYLNYWDPVSMNVWRVKTVAANVLAAKTALVGNFAMGCTLYDREQANVRVSENVNDDFIKNTVRVLAELRAALTVQRPDAFEKITLI